MHAPDHKVLMSFLLLPVLVLLLTSCTGATGETPVVAGITEAMKDQADKQVISGAVTLVARPGGVAHLSAVGLADIDAQRPMRTDTIFWIASMTKPVTSAAILALQDDGKLTVDDLVGKYVPELAEMKTRDGNAFKLTLRHLLTHTSGLAEASNQEVAGITRLEPLMALYAKKRLNFEPGSKWQYSQSGMNTLGRIIEVVSGQSYPEFLQKRFFDPLGMKDTTFYPKAGQLARMVAPYKRVAGKLQKAAYWPLYDPTRTDRYPAPNGGLFSTAPDYGRFARMLLCEGELDGKRYLKADTVKLMRTLATGDLKAGFVPGSGWGLGVVLVREPQGVTADLSPGTFGHGGAWGTQVWIDPVKKVAYVLMIQRTDLGNADGSEVRRAFQSSAAAIK